MPSEQRGPKLVIPARDLRGSGAVLWDGKLGPKAGCLPRRKDFFCF